MVLNFFQERLVTTFKDNRRTKNMKKISFKDFEGINDILNLNSPQSLTMLAS